MFPDDLHVCCIAVLAAVRQTGKPTAQSAGVLYVVLVLSELHAGGAAVDHVH